jgi:molecular chaperone GrpE
MSIKDENRSNINNLDEQDSTEGSSSSSVDELQANLKAQAEELQALHDKYLRSLAEFDNYKKLVQRERTETSKFANENILRDLLPIIDNLERAVNAAKDGSSSDGLIRGVDLTLKQFREVLAKYGVLALSSVGTPFDPAWHQAMATVETTNQPDNHVIEEFQKGYQLYDRILRPAMVSVAMAPADSRRGATAKADADFD